MKIAMLLLEMAFYMAIIAGASVAIYRLGKEDGELHAELNRLKRKEREEAIKAQSANVQK